MSKLTEKLKRMVPFHAESKQKLLMKQIKDPDFELGNLKSIDQKFNQMCQKQAHQLVNLDLKCPPPQLDEEQLRAYQTNSKTQRIPSRSKQSLVRISQMSSVRQSLTLQTDSIHTISPISGSLCMPSQSRNKKRMLSKSQKQLSTTTTQKQQKSQSQLKTAATLASAQRLSPLKINKEKQSDLQEVSSPDRKLNQHFQMRNSMGNVRFSNKKVNAFFGNEQENNKKKAGDQESDIDERVSQSPEWILIQQKLKNAIKNKKQDKGDDYVNPVVQLFGNNFIAMVLQALVIKKIDDVFGLKINTDSNIPISESLLKQFGISSAMINSLNSANEKKQYIADTMTARISLMIKEWDDKQSTREDKLKQETVNLQKEESRKDQNQGDMFEWLKINTNHDLLKRKLRMSIIEKLTDFENQDEISQFRYLKHQTNTQENLKQTGQKNFINLKNIPYVSTKVLLLKIDEKDNKYLKEGLTKEQLDQYEEVQHVDFMNENKKHSSKQNVDEQMEQHDCNNYETYKKTFLQGDELPEWTEDLEREFLNNKRMARIIYSQDIPVSSWSQQGYLPLVQEYNLTNKKKMEREQLITNYQNGVWLTEKELKFIADTSHLLNKCIDKSYVQKIVSHISHDDVSRLELSLAENIITNYENMQSLIREQRLKFLKERQAKTIEQREEARKKQMIQEQRDKEVKIQRRYVKMFKRIGDRLISNKYAYTFEVLSQNFFCRLFFEKMREILKRFRKRKEFLEQSEEHQKQIKLENQLANQKDFVKRLAKAEITKKVCGKQHELHPPSKISYFAPSDEPIEVKREDLMNFMVDRFKLSTRSKQEVRVQQHFSKYYSGGPQKQEESTDSPTLVQLKKITLTKAQFAGIVRVQRLFRQFRMRKIIKNMKEQEFQVKSQIYRDKLRSYMSGRGLLKIASQKLGRQLVPDLIKIEKFGEQKNEDSDVLYSSDDEQGNYKDKTQKTKSWKRSSQVSKTSQQPTHQTIIPIPLQEVQSVKDIKNFYHVQGRFEDNQTLSTDRHHIISKTQEDDSQSKYHNSTIKFLTTEKNDTQSNLDYTENLSNESPKTSKTRASQQLEPNKRFKTLGNDDKNRISFAKTNDGSTTHKHGVNASLGSFLTPKNQKYAPSLLLKQQKLLQAAKMNQFLMIKNSGFNITEQDVNCKDRDQNTPLMYAVSHQNLVFIRWLLSKGADINNVCAQGNTPTHQAFKTNNQEIIHDVLCMKPNLNIVNAEALTPLAYASLETIKKFSLKEAIVYKSDAVNICDEADLLVQDNEQFFAKERLPFKGIGKVRINSFFPIKTPTIQPQNYTSM